MGRVQKGYAVEEQMEQWGSCFGSVGSNREIVFHVLEGPTMTAERKPPFAAYTWTETPPYVFNLGNKRKALVSNSRSILYNLQEGKSVFDAGAYQEESAKFAVWPLNTDAQKNRFLPQNEMLQGSFWRLVYCSAFGVYQKGDEVYALLHGENKNNKEGGHTYRNTVRPATVRYKEEEFTDEHSENWDNYFSFLSMSHSSVKIVEETGNLSEEDYGPIIWPMLPYLDQNGAKKSQGPRHPSYIIKDGYIYVYYIDFVSPEEERVCCARAKLQENGRPEMFYKLYRGEFSEPALPEGFNQADTTNFYRAGGLSDAVLPSKKAIRFYPAKLQNTPYYIGLLEETINGCTHQLKLCVSNDLKVWTNETLIPMSVRESWDKALMHYPMVTDSSFCAGNLVDPQDFTLVGTTFVNGINGGWPTPQYMRLRVEITEGKKE